MSIQSEADRRANAQIQKLKFWLDNPESVDDYIKELHDSGSQLHDTLVFTSAFIGVIGIMVMIGILVQ